MREILFRGKTKDGGEWVEGFFAAKENKSYIITVDTIDPVKNHEAFIAVEVIPETVGQFTGLYDVNETRIFEGDIIKHYNDFFYPENFDMGRVYWFDKGCIFLRSCIKSDDTARINHSCKYEVIGNKHDNPELLEVNGNA